MKIKNQHLTHIFELNIAMLFISTSGVLGRYISMPPPITIWMRSALAIVFLGIFIYLNHNKLSTDSYLPSLILKFSKEKSKDLLILSVKS